MRERSPRRAPHGLSSRQAPGRAPRRAPPPTPRGRPGAAAPRDHACGLTPCPRPPLRGAPRPSPPRAPTESRPSNPGFPNDAVYLLLPISRIRQGPVRLHRASPAGDTPCAAGPQRALEKRPWMTGFQAPPGVSRPGPSRWRDSTRNPSLQHPVPQGGGPGREITHPPSGEASGLLGHGASLEHGSRAPAQEGQRSMDTSLQVHGVDTIGESARGHCGGSRTTWPRQGCAPIASRGPGKIPDGRDRG